MYRRFRERFGTAGVLIGVIALVLALVTGAYAAGGGLSGKQKKEVEKIAKKYAGKPGAPGAAGTNGTNGSNGAPGAKGDPGESVAVNAYTGAECAEGESEEGAELTNSTGTAYACNGAEGSPWTAGGKLPTGSTENGSYAVPAIVAGVPGFMSQGETQATAVSFTLPPSAAPAFVYVAPEGEAFGVDSADGCPGVVSGIAKAASGKFCVYGEPISLETTPTVTAVDPSSTEFPAAAGVSRSGAALKVECTTGNAACLGAGLWAVTG